MTVCSEALAKNQTPSNDKRIIWLESYSDACKLKFSVELNVKAKLIIKAEINLHNKQHINILTTTRSEKYIITERIWNFFNLV